MRAGALSTIRGAMRALDAPAMTRIVRTDLFAELCAVDDRLTRHGVPPMSDYWREEARKFYTNPSAKLLVEMVGRGGDKSRTSTKMAIAEVLAGPFAIPPGERHYFTHVAENRDEAAKTLGVLEQYLRLLGCEYERAGDTIELGSQPRGFKVLACRIGAVSGWRCIGWTADECAKWHSEGADPSAEVIASIRAMTVTHPMARGRMFSSPLGILGHFYDTWVAGDSETQIVGHAPSWVGNPSVTQEQTHALERNERKWKREYAAIPTQETDEAMFSAALLDKCTRAEGDVSREMGVTYVAWQDVGFVRNAWTLCIAGKRWVKGRIKRSVVFAKQWQGSPDHPLDPAKVLTEMAPILKSYGCEGVWSDQYEQFSLSAVAERMQLGIGIWVEAVQSPERLRRYEALLTWMSDDEVDLHPDRQLRADLLAVEQKLTTAGFTVHLPETADGRHTDYAPSVIGSLTKATLAPEAALPARGTAEYNQLEEDRLLKAAKDHFIPKKGPTRLQGRRNRKPLWWEKDWKLGAR